MISTYSDTGNDDEQLLVYYIEKEGFIYCLFELTTGISQFGETPITLSGWKIPRTKQKLKNQLKALGLKEKEITNGEWKELQEKVDIYLQKEEQSDILSPFYINYENDIPYGKKRLQQDDYRNLFSDTY